jgi:peptidoglycan-associated lipoprotein
MNKLVILLASLMIVACSSPTPPAQSTPQGNNPSNNSTGDAASTSSATSARTDSTDATTASTANAPTAAAVASTTAAPSAASAANEVQVHNASIYFDFDEANVKTTFRDVLEKQVANYKNHRNEVLVLEGNADERGSVAYNLALGERRATSVKKALVQLGVPAANTRVVSFGNTKPRLTCHEEKCWQENRRVDFTAQ